jgi:hypothetical protein
MFLTRTSAKKLKKINFERHGSISAIEFGDQPTNEYFEQYGALWLRARILTMQ